MSEAPMTQNDGGAAPVVEPPALSEDDLETILIIARNGQSGRITQFEIKHLVAGYRASLALPELTAALETLLTYFGGPQGVSLQELGHDAYVALEMKVRIGDLIDARAALLSETQKG